MSDTHANPHLVLVHGVCHGAWCRYKIRCLLETSGCKVTCLDLKSAGIDESNPNTNPHFPRIQIHSSSTSCPICQRSKRFRLHWWDIIVKGWLSLTDAIRRFANKIHMAIYVAANMLKHGFFTDQDVKHGDPDVSEYGDTSELEYGMGPEQPPTSFMIKREFQREILHQMSPKEDSIFASMLLRAAPIRALKGAQFEEGKDADSVPRVYIKTLHDHLLKLVQQEAMIKRWQPSQVFVLESDHSPFFSTPSLLFSFLAKAAASI